MLCVWPTRSNPRPAIAPRPRRSGAEARPTAQPNAAMKFKPRRSEEPEINVVSLIDVVLLLVVFFMLSSNFTAEGRLRIRLPQASALPVQRPGGEGLVV